MAGADIELLFGVLGGGSPSGQSGAKIQNQLNNIIGHVNKRIPGIEIKLDPGHKQNFEQELRSLTQTAREEANKIQAAYNGIVFPPIPPGGGPGGRSGGSGGINSLIKQAENAIKRMTLFRDKWTEGMNASDVSGFKPFFNYKGVIEETQDLVTQLRTGSIAVDEFVNKFALLGQVAATNEKHITNFKEVTAEIKRLEDYQNKFSAAKDNPQTRTFYDGITTQLRELERLRDSLVNNLISPEAYRSSFEQIKLVLKDAFDGIMSSGINFNQFKDLEKYHKLLGQIETDIDKIDNGVSDWSALEPSDVAELERLKDLLNDIETRVKGINQAGGAFKFDIDLDNEFKAADAELKAFLSRLERSGKTFGTFGDQIFNMIDDFSAYIDLADIVFETIRMISDMKDIVTELDTAMTELRKVTDEADSTYAAFLDESSSRAQKLGATMVDVVSATADFARLGNDLDDASALADAAIIYKNVGDGIEDIDVASASIISTMQAFNIEAKDAMSIVDSFNNVGNKFAVSSAGIGEALLNSAASLAAAGNDIHESIAMIAAANTTIQNPGRVGTALKTMSMYMRAAKTEAEEAGLSTEGMAESVSQLREELLSLTGGAVDIMSDVEAGKYKSTVEMLRELSVVWKDLSDTSRTNITELIGGGVRNANIIAALMDNFSIVEDALAASVDSVGSAVAENEKYLDSIAGKIAKVNAAYESLSSSLVDSGVVKFFVDFGTVVVKSITGIIDVFGPLIATVTAGKLINGLRNIGEIWEKLKGLDRLGPLFKGLESSFDALKGLGGSPFSIANAFILIAGAIATIYDISKKNKESLINNALSSGESYREQADDLQRYRDEILALNKTIFSDASSSSEQYSARERLLEIQRELIENYGSEAEALNILAASADEAASAYDDFAAKESKQLASKNLTNNASIIEKSIEAMEKVRTYTIRDVNLSALPQEATKSILDVISKYDAITYDRQDRMIRIEADASEAQEELYAFAEDMRVLERQFAADGIDIGEAAISWIYDDSWSKAIESQLSKVNEVIDEYGAIYDDAIVWKIASEGYTDINNEAKSYNSLMSDITDAQNDFQDAVISSYDSEEERAKAVKAAMERINELKSQFGAITFAEDDLGVRDYFLGLFEQMESALDKEQLRIDIAATINGEAPNDGIRRIMDNLTKFSGIAGANTTATLRDLSVGGNVDLTVRPIVDAKNLVNAGWEDAGEGAATVFTNTFSNKAAELGKNDGLAMNFTPILTDESGNFVRVLSPAELEQYANEVISGVREDDLNLKIGATYVGGDAIDRAVADAEKIHKLHEEYFINPQQNKINAYDILLGQQEVEAALTKGGGSLNRGVYETLSEQAVLYLNLKASCDAYGYSVSDLVDVGEQLGFVYYDTGDIISNALESGETRASALQSTLKSLWSFDGFKDTKDELIGLADTITGITPEKIEELADESDALAEVLDQDGMSAEFLAHILQEVAEGRDGFALITDEALRLNKALSGTSGILEKVTKARERYNAAMSVTEKDDNFKSFSEAFAALNEEFVAGTTNSNKFWAAAEYIFGEDQLEEWGWSEGLAQIRQAMNDNVSIFKNAESAGTGFLQRIQTMATTTGDILDENGDAIANIKREADGSIAFEFFDIDSVAKLADIMNLSEEAVLACIEALSMYGDVDFRNIAEVFSIVEESGYAMEFAGKKAVNVAKLTDSLRALGKTGKEIADIKSDLEEYGVTLVDFDNGIDGVVSSLQSLGVATQTGDMLDINEAWLAPVLHGLALTKEEAISLIDTLGGMSNISIDKDAAIAALEKYDFASANDGIDGMSESLDTATEKANTAEEAVRSVKAAMIDLSGTKADVEINVKTNLPDIAGSITGAGDKTKKNGGGLFTPTTQVDFQARAAGTKHASAGPALLGDEFSQDGSPRPELVVSGDRAYVAGINGPEISYLSKGDVVYPADETRRILRGSRNGVIPSMPAHKKGWNLEASQNFSLTGSSGTEQDVTFARPIKLVVDPGPGGTYPPSESEGASGTFEDIYKEHQHLRAMDKESLEDYLDWLEGAYKTAYENGEIELDDFRKYEEEVYEGRKDLFDDYLNDKEFSIDMMEKNGADSDAIIGSYREIMSSIEDEIAAAKERGLTENDDYVQDLMGKWWDYNESISDIEQEALDASRDAFKDHLNDTEHQIDILGQTSGNESKIIDMYRGMMSDIEKEIEAAKASGLDSNDDYIQELESQWWDYNNSIADMEEQALEASRDEFQDYLNDTEHQIDILQHSDGDESEIIGLYQSAMDAVQQEIEAAKASGLDSNDDYVQELESKWWGYRDAIADIEEEALEESRNNFQDYLNDIEHQIDILGRSDGNDTQIINLYQGAMDSIAAEIEAAKASGLDSNDDYVQELERQWNDYADQIESIQEKSTDNAIGALEELIDFRIDMLKQDINDEKDSLNKRLGALREFYDEQKELLQDKYDEEKYLDEQAEKRRAKSDIEAEMATLRRDDSAWAQKRLLELQEELNEAQKDLDSFEKDHALESATDVLDKLYERQAESIEAQIDALDEKLNDPKALYNQALNDIRNNTADLFYAMVGFNDKHGDGKQETVEELWSSADDAFSKYFAIFGEHYKGIVLSSIPGISSVGYASGTRSATPGLHRVNEHGDEAVFTSADGSKYRLFSGGEKVLNANATGFLYNFANNGRSILSKIFDGLTGLRDLGRISKPTQLFDIKSGDINIQGNADSKTVSQIRREQRESIDYILKEFGRLNR